MQFFEKIRKALRLVHCVQKERGTTCPVLLFKESKDDDIKLNASPSEESKNSNGKSLSLLKDSAQSARDNTDAAIDLLFTHEEKAKKTEEFQQVQEALDHIRLTADQITAFLEYKDDLDTEKKNFYDVILLFNALVAGVIRVHIVDNVKKHQNNIQLKGSQYNAMREISSSGTDTILPEGRTFLKENQETLAEFSKHAKHEHKKIPKGERSLSEYGSSTKIMNHITKKDHLLSVILQVVLLKESTGMQRAVLCSLLVMEDLDVTAFSKLYSDLIMEEVNHKKLMRELRVHVRQALCNDEIYKSLMSLVKDTIRMCPQMEELQEKIRFDFDVKSLQQSISLEELWHVITLYMDQLYALELLIVEELQSCMIKIKVIDESTTSVSTKEKMVGKIGAVEIFEKLGIVLGDKNDSDILKVELSSSIMSMTAESLKSSLLCFLKEGASQEFHHEKELASKSDRSQFSPICPSLPYVPSAEWEISLSEVQFRKRIGKGLGGTTYIAQWGGLDVAVKLAAITDMGLEGWNTEVQSLQKLHHPNIIRLLGSIYNPNPRTYGLVLELCDAGDLSEALKRSTPSNFFHIVSVDIANGMKYLHTKNVLHRDIKPGNILLCGDLLNGKFTAKLTDFGVAKISQGGVIEEEHTAETGTYRWMAPEVIRHEEYSFMADVYSFAVVIWQLVTHEEPFKHRSQIEAAGSVALDCARPPIPQETPKLVEDLIRRCWSENPKARFTFNEICIKLQNINESLVDHEIQWLGASLGHPVYEECIEQRSNRKSKVKTGIRRFFRQTPSVLKLKNFNK